MDYAKSGSASTAKAAPKAKRHTAKGAPARPDAAARKQALLDRMKAAATRKG